MSKPQRVRGGAAAEERLIDAVKAMVDLFLEIRREAKRNPLLVIDVTEDGEAVGLETLDYIAKELNPLLKRRDQAVDDMRDLVKRIEELETWRAQQERSERAPIPLRKAGEGR